MLSYNLTQRNKTVIVNVPNCDMIKILLCFISSSKHAQFLMDMIIFISIDSVNFLITIQYKQVNKLRTQLYLFLKPPKNQTHII